MRLLFAVTAVAVFLASVLFLELQFSAASGLVLQQKFEKHKSAVSTADFDDKEELIASGGDDGLRVWRLDSATEVFHEPAVIYKARFIKGGSLLTAGHEAGILLYDCDTWKVRRKLGPKGTSSFTEVSLEADWIAATFASPGHDAKDFPVSTDIYIWHYQEGKWQESILRGHLGPVLELRFIPGSAHLISRGEDWILRVWDLSSCAQIDKPGENRANGGYRVITSCALTRLLAAKSVDDYVIGRETFLPSRAKIDGIQQTSLARIAAYSFNRKLIATGHEDGTLHVWDAKSLVERAVAKGSINGSPLNEVRFSHSGKLIVTAGKGIVPGFEAIRRKVKSDDTVVRVWRVNVDPD